MTPARQGRAGPLFIGRESFWGPSFEGVSLLLTAELAWMVDTWSVGQGM